MFKERSYDLNIDFILNFGQIIRKRAWDTEDFESTLKDIDLLKYYILALDDKCTYGIPVCFTYIDGKYYAYINHDPKYIKIKKLQTILKDEKQVLELKSTNIMDWNHKYRFIFNNGKEMMLNYVLFNMNNIISYDISNLKFDKFIIDGRFVGTYVLLINNDRLYPMYILNPNFIRFNHCIINVDQILTFIQLQQFRNNNFIYKSTNWKINNIELFLEYDLVLHHIHSDKTIAKKKTQTQNQNQKPKEIEKQGNEKKEDKKEKKERKENTIPEDAKEMVDNAMKDLKDKKKKKVVKEIRK